MAAAATRRRLACRPRRVRRERGRRAGGAWVRRTRSDGRTRVAARDRLVSSLRRLGSASPRRVGRTRAPHLSYRRALPATPAQDDKRAARRTSPATVSPAGTVGVGGSARVLSDVSTRIKYGLHSGSVAAGARRHPLARSVGFDALPAALPNNRLAFLGGRRGHGECRLGCRRAECAVAIHPSAHGFQTAAGDYQRARPDYPDEAGRWLAERLDLRPGRKVVDIAAGTGKLTRALVATGARSSRSSRWRGCASGWMRR